MTTSAEMDTPRVIAAVATIEIPRTEIVGGRLSLVRQALFGEAAMHHSFVSVADQAIASATNFLTGVIIARACSKEELGLYMLGFTLFLFLADLQTSLIATPYMIFAPRLKGTALKMYTGSTLVHQFILCLITVLGLVAAGIASMHGLGPQGLGKILWVWVAVVTFIMFREHMRRLCFASLNATRALLLDVVIAIVQISGLLVLARFHILSANRAYWVIGFACGVAVLSWLWSESSLYQFGIAESVADLQMNWTFAKWALGSGFVWTLSTNLYPWFLAVFHGTASVGVWAACLGVVALGNPAVLGVQNFLGPKISHVYALEGVEGLYRFVTKATIAFALPMLLFCIAMMLRGESLMAALYGHQYIGNSAVVSILAWNLTISAVASSFSRALFAMERADVDFAVNFIGLFIMLTLGLWLVRSFGVAGAALALLLANAATSGARGLALRFLIRAEVRRQLA